jgi:metal-responsive CopG/Arc/MetJ family transcriptional regulator
VTPEYLQEAVQQAHKRLTIQSETMGTLLVLYEAQRSELAQVRAKLAALEARIVLNEQPLMTRLRLK